MVPTSLLSLIKKKLEEKGLTNEAQDDVQWQLLSGKIGHSGNKLLLSKAAAIFRVSAVDVDLEFSSSKLLMIVPLMYHSWIHLLDRICELSFHPLESSPRLLESLRRGLYDVITIQKGDKSLCAHRHKNDTKLACAVTKA